MARAPAKSDKKRAAKKNDDEKKKKVKRAAAASEVEEIPDPPEADEERDEETDADERDGDEGEDGEGRVKPVLTPMANRAVRDDDIREAQISGEELVKTEQAEAPANTDAAEAAAENAPHAQLQELKLNDLKRMKITELSKMAHNLGIEGTQGLKKQELLVSVLSNVTEKKYEVQAEGVMEMMSDGYGFLRSADSDYQPSPDDIYVSPSQVRRFNLRPGDTVTGPIRQPREGERYFALQRVEKINFADPFSADVKERILFDNLTALYPTKKLKLEHDANDYTTRIIDLFCPIGLGQRCLIVAPP